MSGGSKWSAWLCSTLAGCALSTSPKTDADHIPPTIHYVRTPPENNSRWSNTDIELTFECADVGSGVSVCPEPIRISSEGLDQSITVEAIDSAGNIGTLVISGLSIDKRKPSIVAGISPRPSAYGWNRSSLTVSYVCADILSGVTSCPPTQVVMAETSELMVEGTATDAAGNHASTRATIRIDRTAPTLRYEGTMFYQADEELGIRCLVTDALSGIADSDCDDVLGPAYLRGPGTHTLTASAHDRADNISSASFTYQVQVSTESLCAVSQRVVSSEGVATSLCMKLRNAQANIDRGSTEAAAGLFEAYANEVSAQAGRAISSSDASILLEFAAALRVDLGV